VPISQFIQPLEQRMFLSVSSSTLSGDLATVHNDAGTVRGEASSFHKTVAADLKTLSTDVRALKVASNNKLLAKVNADAGILEAKTLVAEAGLLGTGESLSAVVTAEGKLLLLKPSNTKLSAKLASDTASLNSKVATKLSALQTAVTKLQTGLDTDLSNIDTANSSSATVAADVSRTETDIASRVGSYNSSTSTFQAAIVALTNALNSIA
jgi:delta 1-pyrroline-5-carboxylate dehydrogenase